MASMALTSIPRLVSASASHEALVLTISPRVSSVPMHRMAAVMDARLLVPPWRAQRTPASPWISYAQRNPTYGKRALADSISFDHDLSSPATRERNDPPRAR